MRKKWVDDKGNLRNSRAKYKCSTALATFIDITNQLSDDGGLPEIQTFIDNLKAEMPEGTIENFNRDEMAEATAEEIVYGLLNRSGWFIDHLLNRARELTGETIGFSDGLYVLSSNICNSLLNIYAGIKMDVDVFVQFVHALNEVRTGIRKKNNLGVFSLRANPIITENNKVEIRSKSILFDAIEDIDADRLRICQVCNHIFWAKRSISEGCSEPCVNALYQRNLRKKNKEEINCQRRKNYYIKNRIPYCEKCIYPNTKCSCYINERSKNNGTI